MFAAPSYAQVEFELPCPAKIAEPSLGTNSDGGIAFSSTFQTRSLKGKDGKGKPVTIQFCKTIIADLGELDRIGRDGTEHYNSKRMIGFKKYQEIAQSLKSMKKRFLEAYSKQCGDQRKPSEQIADEIDVEENFSPFTNTEKYRAMLYAEALEKSYARIDATSTAGVQERQMARLMTPARQKQRDFCSKVESVRNSLFGKNRHFRVGASLDDFVRRYDIESDDDSCNNADYRDLVAKVRSFEICPECVQQRQDNAIPACALQKEFNPVLEKISGQQTSVGSKVEFARAASQMMASLIEAQTPVFREVLKKARADLKELEAKLEEWRQSMAQAPRPQNNYKTDTIRPPTVNEIITKMRMHDGRPYDEIIRTREELLERSKEPLAELKKPISNEDDADDRISYLIRYSPQIVDVLFKRLEQFAACDATKKRALDRLRVSLCERYNSSKSRRKREKWIIDAFSMFSAGAYTGGMVFAAHGNVPGAMISGGVGLLSSVGGDAAKGILETKLYSNRAVASAVFGDTDAAANYLSLRDRAEKDAWQSIGTDVVMGATYFYSAGKVIRSVGKVLAESQALRFEKGAELLASKEPDLVPTLKNIGENITPKQARAIEQAHKIGMKSELEGIQFSKTELRQKAKILEKAGFNESERSALMRSGVTGMESRVTASAATATASLNPQAELSEDVLSQVLGKDKVKLDLRQTGGWNSRKEFRRLINSARYGSHGGKHMQAKTIEQAKAFSYKAAQYLPTVNSQGIERLALQSGEGVFVKHGNATIYKLYRLEAPIGYDQGNLTRWVRVEYSSGSFHGHPISLERVRNYIPNALE